MKKQQGNISIIILVLVFVAIVVWLVTQGRLGSTTSLPTPTPEIENSTDLDAASRELDNTDLNSMDSELEQVKTDSSSLY